MIGVVESIVAGVVSITFASLWFVERAEHARFRRQLRADGMDAGAALRAAVDREIELMQAHLRGDTWRDSYDRDNAIDRLEKLCKRRRRLENDGGGK